MHKNIQAFIACVPLVSRSIALEMMSQLQPFPAIMAALLLAAAVQPQVHAQDTMAADVPPGVGEQLEPLLPVVDLLEPFLGCWDDQFTGNLDSYLHITDTELVVSFAAGSPPLTFTILSNYTTTYATGSEEWIGLSVIAANSPDDPWSAGKFSDFDFMLGRDDEWGEKIMYCQIDYNDPTAEEASKPESPPEIDYLKATTSGCNGYPFSVMTRSVGGTCKPDGTDDTTSAAVYAGATKKVLALLGLLSFGALVL